MDTIFLNDLRVETIVGIWNWERQMPQTVSIDLEMAADIKSAAAADALEATLDYKAVSTRVVALVKKSQFKLVDTMAEAIAETIMSEFSIPWVRVRVHKPWAISGARDVGVCIERGER
jgi:dihydroneopterin aldolase